MKAPALATWLLERLAAENAPLVGDLREEWHRGRSRNWYWRQVLAAIAAGILGEVNSHRLLAVRAVTTGWIVLLLLFFLLGDLLADGLAEMIWGWTRDDGYGAGVWWPYWLTAAFVSYGGFALSAWVVGRLHQPHSAAMLVTYLGSVLIALLGATTYVAWVAPRPVPVPHTLYYVVSVALTPHWPSGFLFVPLVILLAGWFGSRRSTRKAVAA